MPLEEDDLLTDLFYILQHSKFYFSCSMNMYCIKPLLWNDKNLNFWCIKNSGHLKKFCSWVLD